MKDLWLKLAARFDVLQKRERILTALALLGVIFGMVYVFVIDPNLTRTAQAEQQLFVQKGQLAEAQKRIAELQAPNQHPDARAKAELELVDVELAKINTSLKEFEDKLVSPERMRELLQDMIGPQKSSLRILALKTLPPEPLLTTPPPPPPDPNAPKTAAKAPEPPPDPDNGLFKHGVEIRLEGSYADLMGYVQRLEQSKSKLLWSRAVLSADKHPKLVLTLTVYSLSLKRIWLIV